MKTVSHDTETVDPSNAEYVILQTGSMNSINKSITTKIDNLSLLLQESDSVSNFRFYLDSINSGHFLDFWFACQGFKNFDRSDTHKLHQLTKVIYRAYIRSESPYAVPLKQNTKKSIVDKLSNRKYFDQSIFDTAQLEIREILSGEFLINFFQSPFYVEPKQTTNLSTNSFRIQDQLNEMPVTSCSSTVHIGRRFSGAKLNLVVSRSSEPVTDGNYNKIPLESSIGQNYTTQNTGTITTVFNNNILGNNSSGTGLKDRRNLSEIDPPAFAKLLFSKLEEVLEDQAKFEKILRLVKSVPTESDTDDSSSSAISYLMRCQWDHSLGANSMQSIENNQFVDVVTAMGIKTNNKLKSALRPTDIRDDHAHDILENHCSRIGLDEHGIAHFKRDSYEGKTRWRRELDMGSITSYDSGVATSLEQYSNLGIPGSSTFENFSWQKSYFKPINLIDIGIDNSSSSHRYHHHHHHHHHHHKNHFSISKNQLTMENDNNGVSYYKGTPTKKNNTSEVSSTFDSGVSSAYEHIGRRFQPINDKVANWMCKNPNITSNSPYNVTDYESNITSGIPPNTPLIPIRGYTSQSLFDICPNQIYMIPKSIKHPTLYSPVPECESFSHHQNLENWLQQQATINVTPVLDKSSKMSNYNYQRSCYCSSTVGVSGSDLLISDEAFDSKAARLNEVKVSLSVKDQQAVKVSSSKSNSLIIGYYIGNDPVPYRTQISDTQYITLGQFKSLVAKKGPFRYFFKRYCDEFDCGVVHEEITKDDAILPLWEGKVVAKIEKTD